MPFCQRCGMELCGMMKFCHNCGAPNQGPVGQPMQMQVQQPYGAPPQQHAHGHPPQQQPYGHPPQQYPQQQPAQTVVFAPPFGAGITVTTTGQAPPPAYGQQMQPQGEMKPCAFCSGEGEDPFNFSNPCRVCGGQAKHIIPAPVSQCARCEGAGHEPFNLNQPCQTCGGKGWITVR